MGWIGSAGDGVGAYQSTPRIYHILAAARCASGYAVGESGGVCIEPAIGRCIPGMGLAGSISAQHRPHRAGTLYPTGSAGVSGISDPDGAECDLITPRY